LQYDQSPTTYSPDGRVFQVEYAGKAVEKSGTTVGIRCKDGVVLAVEKTIASKMLVKNSNRRIANVDLHIGMASCGLAADARQLVNHAREECRSYRSFYGSEIPGSVMQSRVSGEVHKHTLYWWLRPFGVSALVATYDEISGPELYAIEHTGVSYRYFGAALGKHRAGAKTELEKIDFKNYTCREAVKEAARIIYNLHDEVKDKEFELEISWVCDESNRKHMLVPDELRDEAVRLAVEAKEKADRDSDSDDDDEDLPAASSSASASSSSSS